MADERKYSADETRKILASEPPLAQLAETLRANFGAKLVALSAGDRDIGWSKYRDSVATAVPWGGRAVGLKEAREEWQRIKAASLKARDTASRQPSRRKSGVVR